MPQEKKTEEEYHIATPSVKRFDIRGHTLVPEHVILSVKEEKEFLEKYKIRPEQLPKILNNDPVVISLGAKPGQIIKIIRNSLTAKSSVCYRIVIEGESIDIGEFSPPAELGDIAESE